MAKASRVAARTARGLDENATALAELRQEVAELGKLLARIERKVDALSKSELEK